MPVFVGARRFDDADRGGELVVLHSHGLVESRFLTDSDHVRLAITTRAVTSVELPSDIAVHAGLVAFRPREVLFLPLAVHGNAIGVLMLARAEPFGPERRALAEVMSRSLAMALANAMTHAQLQRIAALDPLTGCYNRRFGLTRLREEFVRAQRTEGPMAAVVFDIDHFKSVNDTYGHLVGDRVLSHVAQQARLRLREGDVLMRYGGEEFVAVLPGASVSDAAAIAERMRRAVEESMTADGERQVRVTISLGVAARPECNVESETDLLGLADSALYRAKQGGRNRVVVPAG